ncbi:type I-C CRISPR-associated protein Cas8c/Csd1 [Methyloversatilis sp.]|uniref:type I-C CRISPR-associated protein Cas8c/Csd1 n=1 Tax=Methyloversatilis sp. TaxID=2569862 RepID=UPI00345AFA7A
MAPIARLHPAIKGVNGAQSSGASLVSFNLDAFTSYGKSQGDNAPISEQAAFAYTSVLNYLLRRSPDNRQRLQVGDTSVVFWAEAAGSEADAQAAESFLASLLVPADDDSEAERLRTVLDGLSKGRPLAELAPGLAPGTRMYVLGLAPNASRLSVRYWQADTLEVFAKRLAEHAQDLRIEPLPWRVEPSVYRLLLATVPNREGAMPKADDAFDNLIGETMRAILSGGLYPRSLLANTVMRIRSDGNLSGMRAAICKGVLTRERRRGIHTSDEEIPVSLDKQSTLPGYQLGRLFAVLEYVQRCALGGQVNATIRDRYYGAASATPAAIFPVLLRNTQNHLGKLRKERPGQAVTLEREIRDIVEGLPDRFPRSLKIEGQGSFAIGYYHQSHTHFTKRDAAGDAVEHTETEIEGAL